LYVIINPHNLGYLKFDSYLSQNRDQWQGGVDTKIYVAQDRNKWQDGVDTKIYVAQDRNKWQDGVHTLKVIWFRTETSGRMVWTLKFM
jgi:hypothetical protein